MQLVLSRLSPQEAPDLLATATRGLQRQRRKVPHASAIDRILTCTRLREGKG